MKKEFTLEFEMNTSPQLIFSFVDTAEGLQDWFADKVSDNRGIFTFKWNDYEEKAVKINSQKNESVKYAWIEDESEDISTIEEEYFFGFSIIQHELTGDVSLLVSFYEEDLEFENEKNVWEHQIQKLKQKMGLS